MSTQNNNRTDQVLTEMSLTNDLLKAISAKLDTLIMQTAPVAPDWRRPLAAFRDFNFETIGAKVVSRDKQGPTAVEWNGHQFTRRSGDGKFGKAIWFSRSLGQVDGETKYARLIAFKGDGKVEAERVPFNI